ncbi:hypothetical protein MBLNU230_g4883t1 [Neophaeotheca triangularis]
MSANQPKLCDKQRPEQGADTTFATARLSSSNPLPPTTTNASYIDLTGDVTPRSTPPPTANRSFAAPVTPVTLADSMAGIREGVRDLHSYPFTGSSTTSDPFTSTDNLDEECKIDLAKGKRTLPSVDKRSFGSSILATSSPHLHGCNDEGVSECAMAPIRSDFASISPPPMNGRRTRHTFSPTSKPRLRNLNEQTTPAYGDSLLIPSTPPTASPRHSRSDSPYTTEEAVPERQNGRLGKRKRDVDNGGALAAKFLREGEDGRWMKVAEEVISRVDEHGAIVTDAFGCALHLKVEIQFAIDSIDRGKIDKPNFSMRYAGGAAAIYRAETLRPAAIPASGWAAKPAGRKGWQWTTELADATNADKFTPAQRFRRAVMMYGEMRGRK